MNIKIFFKILLLLSLIIFVFHIDISFARIDVDSLSLDIGLQKDSSGNDNVFLSIYSCLSSSKISLEYESNMNKYKSEESSSMVFDQHIQSNINFEKYFIFIDSGYRRNTLINIDEVDFGIGCGTSFNKIKAQAGIYRNSGLNGDETKSKIKIIYNTKLSELLCFAEAIEYGQNIEASDDFIASSVSSLILMFEKFFTFKLSYKYIFNNNQKNNEKAFSALYATSGIKF